MRECCKGMRASESEHKPRPMTAIDAKMVPGSKQDTRTAGALIIGGAHGSLAVARSLGRQGISSCFVTDDHPLPGFSRYARHSLSWPGPGHDQALAELLGLGRSYRLEGWVLFPGGDAEVRFVAQNHAALATMFRLTIPPWETVQWACDKRLTYQRAASLGIAIPRPYAAQSLDQLADQELRFPLVLKPAARGSDNAFTRAKAWRVEDRPALLSLYPRAAALVGEQAVVVQELIPGTGAVQFSYAAVWDQGRPVASLVARRGRQYPIDFGYTSTYVETVEQPEVETAACRFLASLNYSGLVEIEFKFDARDGCHKILDVNPRCWTWIALGAAAGVDFPHMLWRVAMGESLPPARGWAGVAWSHMPPDLLAVCRELWAGTLTTRAYMRSLGRCQVFASFAADDPLPGLVELPLVLRRVLARRFGRIRPRAGADSRPLVA